MELRWKEFEKGLYTSREYDAEIFASSFKQMITEATETTIKRSPVTRFLEEGIWHWKIFIWKQIEMGVALIAFESKEREELLLFDSRKWILQLV